MEDLNYPLISINPIWQFWGTFGPRGVYCCGYLQLRQIDWHSLSGNPHHRCCVPIGYGICHLSHSVHEWQAEILAGSKSTPKSDFWYFQYNVFKTKYCQTQVKKCHFDQIPFCFNLLFGTYWPFLNDLETTVLWQGVLKPQCGHTEHIGSITYFIEQVKDLDFKIYSSPTSIFTCIQAQQQGKNWYGSLKEGVYNISHSPVPMERINFYRVSFLFWAQGAHSILVVQYELNL